MKRSPHTRRYTPRLRAEHQARTRQRIVEAAAALHEEVGPRDTTISAVAARAGVQRLTVYRHFPDEASLFRACSSHWIAGHPPPDPSGWQSLADPVERTREVLSRLYAYYRGTQRLWSRAYRDQADIPALAAVMQGFEGYLGRVRDDLHAGWSGDVAETRAVLGHAIRFSTWQSLAGEGLDDHVAAHLATRWLAAIARPQPATPDESTGGSGLSFADLVPPGA